MKRTTVDKRLMSIPGCLAALALVAAPAQSQTPVKTTTPSQFLQPGFTFQPEWWQRMEDRNTSNFNIAKANDPREAQSRLRLNMRYRDPKGWSLFLQPQYSYRNSTGSPTAPGLSNDFDFHQAFVEMRSGKASWRIGRQEFDYGDNRLINPGGDNIGQSFDALKFTLSGKRSATDFFYGKLGQLAYKKQNPTLAGFYSIASPLRNSKSTVDTYLLFKGDKISGQSQSSYTLGMRPHLFFGKGFDSTVESAFQFGQHGPRSISAWAYAANLGYTFHGSSRLRLAVERSAASGGNPDGKGSYGTFDQLFDSANDKISRMNNAGWSNSTDLRFSVQANPGKRWQFNFDTHLLGLQNGKDYWYNASGATVKGSNGKALRDATGKSGTSLGTEFDAACNYSVNRFLGVKLSYGKFLPGSYVRKTNLGHADSTDWFYIQPTYRF